MKRTRIRRVSPGAKLEREARKLCRELVFLRDRVCQRCPVPRSDVQLHWAHVLTRNAKSLVCVPWASLVLCAGCHMYFDGEKRYEARAWWSRTWPERAFKLAAWRQTRPPKINRAIEILWLKQELEAYRAGAEGR